MFEKYTEKARRVIFFARYEASNFGARSIELEHLLLGLFREDKSLVARFLPSSAAVEELRKEIAASMPESTRTSLSIDLPLSPPAMRALGFAAEEAKVADDDYIVPAHLLLGVLHVKGSLAQTWLARKGLTLDSVRAHLQAPSGAGDPLANYKAVVALRDTFYPLLSRLGPEIEPALVLAWGPATKISETI